MKKTKLKFGVIGSGSWATALIKILSENNNDINWYIRNAENIEFVKENSHNPNYLSSVELNLKKLKISAEINEVVEASKPFPTFILATCLTNFSKNSS